MIDRAFLLLATILFLWSVALFIPFAALQSEYSALENGRHISGTVTSVEPHGATTKVVIAYTNGRGFPSSITTYAKDASAYPEGGTVDILSAPSGAIEASKLEEHRPSALLLVGGVLLFLFAFASVLVDRKWRIARARRGDVLDPIAVAIARTRNAWSVSALLFVLFAAFFVVVANAPDSTSSTAALVGVYVLVFVCVGLGVLFAVLGLRLRDPWRNAIIELVTESPHDIAWFYVLQENRRGMTMLSVQIRTQRGKRHAVRVTQEDARAVLAEIERRAPHALRGHSPEIEKAYEQRLTGRPVIREHDAIPKSP
jgi:hypothetical protein